MPLLSTGEPVDGIRILKIFKNTSAETVTVPVVKVETSVPAVSGPEAVDGIRILQFFKNRKVPAVAVTRRSRRLRRILMAQGIIKKSWFSRFVDLLKKVFKRRQPVLLLTAPAAQPNIAAQTVDAEFEAVVRADLAAFIAGDITEEELLKGMTPVAAATTKVEVKQTVTVVEEKQEEPSGETSTVTQTETLVAATVVQQELTPQATIAKAAETNTQAEPDDTPETVVQENQPAAGDDDSDSYFEEEDPYRDAAVALLNKNIDYLAETIRQAQSDGTATLTFKFDVIPPMAGDEAPATEQTASGDNDATQEEAEKPTPEAQQAEEPAAEPKPAEAPASDSPAEPEEAEVPTEPAKKVNPWDGMLYDEDWAAIPPKAKAKLRASA